MLKPETLRLYAVTDRRWTGAQTLEEQIESALRGGVTLVQLREKHLDDAAYLEEARRAAALCHRYGVPLIIDDNVEVALASGADGVHVGQNDMAAGDVRERLGADKILGVTAKTVEQALAAQAAGADYLGVGAVFATSTKTDTWQIDHAEFRRICDAVNIPVTAIGGITRENLPTLAGLGMDGFAVVSAVFAAEDIEAECRALRALAEQTVTQA